MIAHRLSSIKSVDEILVLSEGKIVERGNHNELMAKHRVYKQLVTNYENANDWRLDNEKFYKNLLLTDQGAEALTKASISSFVYCINMVPAFILMMLIDE